MAKKQKRKQSFNSYDFEFLLKLTMYAILGSLWIKILNNNTSIPVPFGAIVGIAIASHEHYKNDRKIQYAVLIIAALIGLIAPYGLYVSI